MPTTTVYSTSGDGRVRNNGSSAWGTLQAAGSGTGVAYATAQTVAVYNDGTSADKYIDRGFFAFDLSALPAGAVVTAATLSLYVYGKDTGAGGAVCLVAGSQASTSVLATSDFSACGTTEFASRVNFTSLTTSAYNDFALNASGLSHVESAMGGTAKFCFRGSFDLDNSAPGTSVYSGMYVQAEETTGTTSDPKLVLTYTTQDATIQGDAGATYSAGPSAGDGAVRNITSGASWATVIAASSGTDTQEGFTESVLVYNDTDYCARGFLAFDTSAIPDSATILSAKIKIMAAPTRIYTGETASLCVVAGTQASTSALATSDFSLVGSTEMASRTTFSSFTADVYKEIALNSAGLAHISKTGFTKFAFRGSKDVDASTPGADSGVGIYYSEQSGTSKDPVLEVTTLTQTIVCAVAVTAPAPVVTITSPSVTVTSPALAVAAAAAAPAVSATNGRFRVTGTGNAAAAVSSASTIFTNDGTYDHWAFPTLTRCANGDLYMVTNRALSHTPVAGSGESMWLVGKRSTDGGATWGSTDLLSVNSGTLSWQDRAGGALRTLASGRVIMAWQRANGTWTSPGRQQVPWVAYSDDDCATWSTPVAMNHAHYATEACPSDIVELANGDLLCVTYGTPTNDINGDWDIGLSSSSDEGATWTSLGLAITGASMGANNVLSEPGLVLLANGNLMMTFAAIGSSQPTYKTFSTDGGATWSTPVLVLSGSINRHSLTVTDDGDVYLAGGTSGTHYLYQSKDHGATFSSAIAVGGTGGAYYGPTWTSTSMISSGVSPTMGVAYSSEGAGQAAAETYFRTFTTSTIQRGGDAETNLAVSVALPAPSVSTTIGGGSVSITSPVLAVTVSMSTPTVAATGGVTVTSPALAVSVTLPSPVIVTTIGIVNIAAPPLAVSVALPTPNSAAETGYRWFRTRRSSMSTTAIKTYVEVLAKGTTRTTAYTSPTYVAKTEAGILVVLDVTAASGTGGLTLRINAHDQASAQAVALNAAPTAVTAIGTTSYALYPFGAVAGNVTQATSFYLPRMFSISVTAGDSSSYTYSLGYCLLP